MNLKTTHFGFEKVTLAEKKTKVDAVFTSVATRYDLMNNIMSLGLHHIWKRLAVELSHIRPGHTILDLAGGSGDLTKIISRQVGSAGKVFIADLNTAMLNLGRDRLLNAGLYDNIHFVQANAQNLPFADNSFHCIIIGFGLRNVCDQNQALNAMYRVCKPGGKITVLEFSKPIVPGLEYLYNWYSFKILPKLGELIAHDSASYQYLVESIRMHPKQEELAVMIKKSGFEDCRYYNLSGGIVAVHVAYKY